MQCRRFTALVLPAVLLAGCLSLCSAQEPAPFAYMQLGAVPRRYSLIDQGRKPTVRSQGELGTCWAISACSAIESDLLPQKKQIFSPDHMSLRNGYETTQEDGGDYTMIMSYLAGWKGPVEEAEDPYGDGVSPEGLRAQVHVQEMQLLRGMSRQQIKKMILLYGAAQSSLCMDRSRTDLDAYGYYAKETAAYYDPFTEELNHDILVLGWDDTYPRENFRIRPARDGAWICQNTWGEDFGDDGIFYVSYEDKNLFRKGGIVYSGIEEASDTQRVCQQDSLGWLGRQGYERETCYFAGVFQAGRQESIRGIGFYTTGPGTACRIFLIPEYTSPEDLESVAPAQSEEIPAEKARLLAAGQIANAGFHTVRIPSEVNLRKGQTYAVAVEINTPGEGKPVAVEKAKDQFTQSVTTQGHQTYLSKDGSRWENTQEAYETNVCMKVYTDKQQFPWSE